MPELQETLKAQTPCIECGSEFNEADLKTHEGRALCENCFSELVGSCSSCEQLNWQDALRWMKEAPYCANCFVEKFAMCGGCGKYFGRRDLLYSDILDDRFCGNCIPDYLEYCSRCEVEINRDDCSRSDDGSSYCDSCWEEESSDCCDEKDDYLQQHELSGRTFIRSKSRRKFGVEIEACLAIGEGAHLAIEELGYWSKQRDGSLGNSGREYASPILQGDEGFKEIEKITAKLNCRGYFVKSTCGLHVHIDGRDLRYEDIKKLLKIVLSYEPVIYAMLPDSRYRGTYSVPLQKKFPPSRMRIKAQDEESLKALWYGRDRMRVNTKSKYHGSRYFGVNIHSWFFRRSIEFRYHSGTLNPAKITNFIQICQALVDKAKRIKRTPRVRSFKSFQDQFDSFVSFLRLSPGLASYMKQRILKFHPDRFYPVAPQPVLPESPSPVL